MRFKYAIRRALITSRTCSTYCLMVESPISASKLVLIDTLMNCLEALAQELLRLSEEQGVDHEP